MNKNVFDIATKAGMVSYPTGLGISENTIWGDRNIAQFAELIVQECMGVVSKKCASATAYNALVEHFGVEERDAPIVSAGDRALFVGIGSSESFTVNRTKKAFGVKE